MVEKYRHGNYARWFRFQDKDVSFLNVITLLSWIVGISSSLCNILFRKIQERTSVSKASLNKQNK